MNKIRISTNVWALLNEYKAKECIKMLFDAGFDTYDFTMVREGETDNLFQEDDYIERAKEIRKYADELGMTCNQTHSVFPVIHPSVDDKTTNKRKEYTYRIIEITQILGAKHCVVHPINDFTNKQNVEFYKDFVEFGKKHNVKICAENMWNWDEKEMHAKDAACSNHNSFKELLDMINDDYFVACLDIGHAEMSHLNTSAVEMIETLGNKLECLHIHDNDKRFDLHRLPFTYKIDFHAIIDALAKINYQGDITFECDYYLSSLPKEAWPEALKLMHKIGEILKDELIAKKATK